MNSKERRAMEAAGYVFEDAEDFLELTPEERLLVELRVAVSRAVRSRREAQGLTQIQAAKKLKTSQPRLANIEAGSSGVTLDLMFRGLFALGGTLRDLRIVRRPLATDRPARQSAQIGMGSRKLASGRRPAARTVTAVPASAPRKRRRRLPPG